MLRFGELVVRATARITQHLTRIAPMKSSFARHSLAIAIGLISGHAWAADPQPAPGLSFANQQDSIARSSDTATRIDEGDLAFGSEREFVERFGKGAAHIADGHYRISRMGVTYDIYFGQPALEASSRDIERHIDILATATGKTSNAEQAAQLERLRLRQAAVQRDLLQAPSKYSGYDTDTQDSCGFHVILVAQASPGWIEGSASTSASVSAGNSTPDSSAFVEFSLSAIAGQPDYQGGLYGTPSVSHVDFSTYSTSVSPPAAYAHTPGWQQCLRASGTAVVRRNPWFPDYCGQPIHVQAHFVDAHCPTGF